MFVQFIILYSARNLISLHGNFTHKDLLNTVCGNY